MKKNIKKLFISLVLCSCITLCSCTDTTEQTVTATEEITAIDSSIIEVVSASEETSEIIEETSEEKNLVNIQYDMLNIEETLLVDNEDFTYKIIDVDPYYNDGTEYTLIAEKTTKTNDPQTDIFIEYIIINGIECNFSVVSYSSNSYISLNYIELSKIGITDITDILIIYNIVKNGQCGPSEDPIHIYPYGKDNAIQFVPQQTENEIVIVDNEYVEIVATSFTGCGTNILIHNKTNEKLALWIYGNKINGYDTEYNWFNTIYANTYKYDLIVPFSLNTILDNNITQISNIELGINMQPGSTDYSNIYETVTINTDIPIEFVEYTPSDNNLIETTHYENYDSLQEYILSLKQTVGADYNFSEGIPQTILYNGAHFELAADDSSICIFVPKTATELFVGIDDVDIISPLTKDDYSYYLDFNNAQSELELPIVTLHEDGTLEKLTLYLTFK